MLVNDDGSVHIIFEEFEDDAYTMFSGKYYYSKDGKKAYSYFRECDDVITEEFTLETEDAAQTYINTIEEKLGGQLNFEALEIEKAQSKVELKSLDMVLVKDYKDSEWYLDTFESMVPNCIYPYKCMMNLWKYCIPYRGNEHLLGTTKDVEG